MAEIYHQTVKGIYNYPQLNNFISVRNYMYIWQNGKKCLILRFFNGFSQEINEFEYTVTQIDINGNIIKQSDLLKKNICISPGAMYSPNIGLLVEEACVDFKLSFKSVRSGKYTYRVFDDTIEAFYPLPPKKFLEKTKRSVNEEAVSTFFESSRVIGKPKRSVKIAIIALVMILLLNIFQFASPYIVIDFSIVKEWFEKQESEQTDIETNSGIDIFEYISPEN